MSAGIAIYPNPRRPRRLPPTEPGHNIHGTRLPARLTFCHAELLSCRILAATTALHHRFDEAERTSDDAQLAEREAHLAVSAAEIEVARADAACKRRERVRLKHEARTMVARPRAAEVKQNLVLSRLATAQAAEARCLEETSMLMVALAEAEAAEAVANAAPVGRSPGGC